MDGKVLNASFKECKINARRINDINLSFYLAFQLTGMKIMESNHNLFLLDNISLDAKVSQSRLNTLG